MGISAIVSLASLILSRVFKPADSHAGTTIAGGVSGIATVGALGSGVLWLFGPGRDWSVTLNAMELSFVFLAGAVLVEFARRSPPPGG